CAARLVALVAAPPSRLRALRLLDNDPALVPLPADRSCKRGAAPLRRHARLRPLPPLLPGHDPRRVQHGDLLDRARRPGRRPGAQLPLAVAPRWTPDTAMAPGPSR